jgi:hypothetical protein
MLVSLAFKINRPTLCFSIKVATAPLLSSLSMRALCAILLLTLFPRFARDAVVPRWMFVVGSDSSPPFLPAV